MKTVIKNIITFVMAVGALRTILINKNIWEVNTEKKIIDRHLISVSNRCKKIFYSVRIFSCLILIDYLHDISRASSRRLKRIRENCIKGRRGPSDSLIRCLCMPVRVVHPRPSRLPFSLQSLLDGFESPEHLHLSLSFPTLPKIL